MKRVVLLTGSELRHTYMRMYLACSKAYRIEKSYCEGLEKSLQSLVGQGAEFQLQRDHLLERSLSEERFFLEFAKNTTDQSNPCFLPKGRINDIESIEEIKSLSPDLLIAYGCSLIKGDLLRAFQGRFINVHLGLSPYYRGSGTNFWPFVNEEPEFVGATFMHMDEGVDTGRVIHQIRARILPGDSVHDIGNRLILDTAKIYRCLIESFDQLKDIEQTKPHRTEKYYRKKDFTVESVQILRQKMNAGLVEAYLKNKEERERGAPILQNPVLIKNDQEISR